MIRPSFLKSLNIDCDDEMTFKDWIVEIICFNDFSCFIRRIYRFIHRLFRWIPVLWEQEEWDFGYTYDILKLRLEELRKNISEDTWHTEECVKEELKQIDSCLSHLDKFRNWPSYIEIPDYPEGFEEFTPTEDGMYSWNSTPERDAAFKKAHEFESKHYKAFWNELKKNSNNWWT